MADGLADGPAPRVGLFVTCLIDAMRPSIGFAAIQLLEEAGCTVEVPQAQTCCGQPAFNSGDTAHAAGLARQVVEVFEPYDYVVVPSGSCGGMIRRHYPEALADDPAWRARAEALGREDLRDHHVPGRCPRLPAQGARRCGRTATYHDACAGLRELDVFGQPRQLLAAVEGLEMRKLEGNDVCCGFGGTFCVKYPAISNAIVEEKAAAIEQTGADLLLAGDLGCLMNMAGKLSRRGSAVRCFHTVEVLAGMGDGPAIGEEGCSPSHAVRSRALQGERAGRARRPHAQDRDRPHHRHGRAQAGRGRGRVPRVRRGTAARAADQGPRDREPRPLPGKVRAQRGRRRQPGSTGPRPRTRPAASSSRSAGRRVRAERRA